MKIELRMRSLRNRKGLSDKMSGRDVSESDSIPTFMIGFITGPNILCVDMVPLISPVI